MDKKLIPSERVKKRPLTVMSDPGFPTAPIVVLDLPALSVVKKQSVRRLRVRRSYRKETEATALLAALKKLRPTRDKDGRLPTLVVLSPYLAQVDHFERLLKHEIDPDAGTLFGFEIRKRTGNSSTRATASKAVKRMS